MRWTNWIEHPIRQTVLINMNKHHRKQLNQKPPTFGIQSTKKFYNEHHAVHNIGMESVCLCKSYGI